MNTLTGKLTLPQTNYFLFPNKVTWRILKRHTSKNDRAFKKKSTIVNILEVTSESSVPFSLPHTLFHLLWQNLDLPNLKQFSLCPLGLKSYPPICLLV